jgi:hypothetical protein
MYNLFLSYSSANEAFKGASHRKFGRQNPSVLFRSTERYFLNLVASKKNSFNT